MRIAYIGRVTLSVLSERFRFDRPLPPVRWGFPLGAEIVCGLVKRGHHVSVIVNDNHSDCIEVYRSNGCDVYIVPDCKRTRWQYLTLFYKEVHGMRECIKRIKPDVVFAQWTYFYAYAGLTSGYPTLVVAHDSPWRVFRIQPDAATLIRALYAQFFVIPKLRHLSAVSPHIANEFAKLGRFVVEVVPNGIAACRGDEARALTREHARTIVMVTQWGELKNSKAMIEAFGLLHKRHRDWRLVVYGNYMDARGAGAWMVANNIPENGIELRGLASRKEIDRVFREEADLFVSPSLEESFGMVFVEAMRFGIPCIGGERSGAVSWVMGEGGVACDVSKPEELANCIERIMGDFELRKNLSAGGIKRVGEMFDIDKVVSMYDVELKKVAQC